MKKKILVIPVLLLTFALLSLPVMGAPATKIEGVTVTAVVTQTPITMRFVSHDNIIHGRLTSAGTVTLNIPGKAPLIGTWNGESVSTVKLNQLPPGPEAELLIMGKLVWTFTGGTFEGVTQRTIIGYPPDDSYYEDHMVLQGTGDFKGQTLKLSYEGPPPVIDEGYLIISK